MIQKNKLIIMFILFTSCGLYADINLELNMCNNQLDEQWVMTAAPEVSLSGQWYKIGVDGSFIGYEPSDRLGNFIIHSRVSLIPMLRAPLGYFFAAIGYGLSKTYQREESQEANGLYTLHSEDTFSGEFRGLIGVAIPLNQKMKLLFKAGYDYVNQNHQYVFVSTGLGFVHPGAVQKTASPYTGRSPLQKQSVKSALDIQKISIVASEDGVINELNRALEVALINAGIQTVSFEKMIDTVKKSMPQTAESTSPFSTDEISDNLEDMEKLDIAFKGAVLLDLDGLVESRMRYYFQSYGGEVIVNTAYVRILDPKNGDIIWAIEFTETESSFTQCKKNLSAALIAAIKNQKRNIK